MKTRSVGTLFTADGEGFNRGSSMGSHVPYHGLPESRSRGADGVKRIVREPAAWQDRFAEFTGHKPFGRTALMLVFEGDYDYAEVVTDLSPTRSAFYFRSSGDNYYDKAPSFS